MRKVYDLRLSVSEMAATRIQQQTHGDQITSKHVVSTLLELLEALIIGVLDKNATRRAAMQVLRYYDRFIVGCVCCDKYSKQRPKLEHEGLVHIKITYA